MEWLQDKKNLPIIAGLAGVVIVAAIVFVLFYTGVLGGSAQTAAAPPTAPVAPTAPPARPGGPIASAPGGLAPPGAPRPPAMGMPPGAPGAAAPGTHPAAPVQVAAAPPKPGAPGARPDPFAPYIDYDKTMARFRSLRPPPPRADTFVPFVRITNYVPAERPIPTGPIVASNPAPPGNTLQTPSIGRVSGVMLTNGAFAIVDNSGQSSILQPGDLLPNGGGRVISIQADGITVRTTGDQMVRVPISAGDTNASGGGNGQQGPPNVPGNIPDQGDNANGG